MIYSLLLLSTDDQDPTPPIVTIHTALDQLLAGFIKSVGDQLGDDEDLRNSILGEVLEGLHNVVSQMNEALSSNLEAGSFSYRRNDFSSPEMNWIISLSFQTAALPSGAGPAEYDAMLPMMYYTPKD